jgi:hypothetical protein
VDKNLLVQNWFRKVWALQLVPPADVANVFEKFIKTTVPYEDDDDDLDDRKVTTKLWLSLLHT